MTIQSVELNSNKSIKNSPTKLESPSKLKKTLKNDSDMDLVESDIISTLPQQSKKFSPIKNSSNVKEKQLREQFETTVQSEYATTLQN